MLNKGKFKLHLAGGRDKHTVHGQQFFKLSEYRVVHYCNVACTAMWKYAVQCSVSVSEVRVNTCQSGEGVPGPSR